MNFLLGIITLGGAGAVLLWALMGSRQTADGPTNPNVHKQELERSALDRVIIPAFGGLGRLIGRFLPPDRIKKLRKRIILSGRQWTWNVPKALALKAFGLCVGIGLAFLIITRWGTSLKMMALAGAVVFAGFYATDYYLDKKVAARKLAIQRQLPDILDQITVCVEAGLGFDAAINRCSQSNHNELGMELGRTLQDIRLGVQRNQALNALLDRTDVQDLRLFVKALIQAERSGIPMAKVLTVQSDEVREKRRQAAEERAMRLPVLLVLPLVMCILPSLFTVIIGPAALRMIDNGLV